MRRVRAEAVDQGRAGGSGFMASLWSPEHMASAPQPLPAGYRGIGGMSAADRRIADGLDRIGSSVLALTSAVL